MNNKEEQEQEIEILRSIYPGELTVYDDTHLEITLPLELDDNETVTLSVTFVSGYPETEIPMLDVKCSSLSQSELDHVKSDLEIEAQANIGMPSVFSLATTLKDKVEEALREQLIAIERQREKELEEQEKVEQAKFFGTPVTKESYTEWRIRFESEFPRNTNSTKLTGKAIFQQGLAKEEAAAEAE
ncbi:hypothetical protein CANCADRAFT_2702 [Tortispora caseinolytica NRRL Y-17796]|uniref:RWD domain-containing protein n=1 Tax=Tortispora caseinolytica NRRL Y-17796 TaxID=767744 RepID=A0A1E4TGV1_9ASCO|nr:hypothetical protein CANCADRAFT_2702 [Tortispora caseinolytica NRRL Y-17796]